MRRAPGGVVTALDPIVRACTGVWVAQASGTVDSETADTAREPSMASAIGYRVRGVPLDAAERSSYYDGFSNEGLWPLCHRTSVSPIFRASDFAAYRAVNARFAAAVCAEADTPAPLVLVQDYHCALAPREIRFRRPDANIVTFWHVPWPSPERFNQCPWATHLVDGVLGSTIVGFQTPDDCWNFLDTVARRTNARVDYQHRVVTLPTGRRVAVRDYPISIEWPPSAARTFSSAASCRDDVRAELGVDRGALLVVGVDRLDYIKGLEEKLLALERLFERRPEFLGRLTLVQLLEPSRESLPAYRDLRCRLYRTAARVNARFRQSAADVVRLVEGHHDAATVLRYLRAADVGYVGSLHDGMNLVAKEFVAAHDDHRGVLVLSRHAGAARELSGALLIDPYDADDAAGALAAAASMPLGAQAARMRAMREAVRQRNVYKWAHDLVHDAARARRLSTFGYPEVRHAAVPAPSRRARVECCG